MAVIEKAVKNDLRRKILNVARQLLLNRGYNQVSIRTLAKAVGCSVGTIYTYFENKDVLIHSLIEEGFEKLVESQLSIEAVVSDPVERLKALCRNYVRFGVGNPEYYEIMYHLSAKQMERYPADKYRRARISLEVLARALEESASAGRLKVQDYYLGANIIWSLLHGMVSLIHFQRIDRRVEQDALIKGAIQQAVHLNSI